MKKSFFKQDVQGDGGFTLIELIVVIAVLALLVATILPSLASSRSNDQAFQCMNNMKQLQLASFLYAGDNNDSIPPNENFPTPGSSIIGVGASYDWVAGSFAQVLPGGTAAAPVGCETNVYFLGTSGNAVPGLSQGLSGSIGQYSKNPGIYKCPADQSTYNGVPRVRSVAANGYVGTTRSQATRWDEIYPAYWYFQKYSGFNVMKTSDCFVFVEESSLTLNSGFFLAPPDGSINERPAVYHGRASSFSFADGHVQLHEWKDAFLSNSVTGPMDPQWLSAHVTVHR